MQGCEKNQSVCCQCYWTGLIVSLLLLTVWPLTTDWPMHCQIMRQSQEVCNYRGSWPDPVAHLWTSTGPLFVPTGLTNLVTTFLSHNALLCSNGVNNKVRWSELMDIRQYMSQITRGVYSPTFLYLPCPHHCLAYQSTHGTTVMVIDRISLSIFLFNNIWCTVYHFVTYLRKYILNAYFTGHWFNQID